MRQTGRTTRMLQKVIAFARENRGAEPVKCVAVYASSNMQVSDLRLALLALCRAQKIPAGKYLDRCVVYGTAVLFSSGPLLRGTRFDLEVVDHNALSSAIYAVLEDYEKALAKVEIGPLIETLCAVLLPEQYGEGEDGIREEPEPFENKNPKPKW